MENKINTEKIGIVFLKYRQNSIAMLLRDIKTNIYNEIGKSENPKDIHDIINIIKTKALYDFNKNFNCILDIDIIIDGYDIDINLNGIVNNGEYMTIESYLYGEDLKL